MTDTASREHQRITVIAPPEGVLAIDFAELWSYRELLLLLIWRDATVRYKQSVVGIGWALIQPVMMMIIFTLVFGHFAGLPSEGVPYPVLALSALLPWNYFARSLSDSSNSLVGSSALVTKIYFPRVILPLSKVFSGLIDFAIAFVLLIAVMIWYRIAPSWRIITLPAFTAMAILVALAVGLWMTALNVRYRDVTFIVPFLVQLWMYASPVAYSTSIVPARWRWFYALNPLTGVIDGFRWALLGRTAPRLDTIAISLAIVVVIFFSGLYYFRRTERTFADII